MTPSSQKSEKQFQSVPTNVRKTVEKKNHATIEINWPAKMFVCKSFNFKGIYIIEYLWNHLREILKIHTNMYSVNVNEYMLDICEFFRKRFY